MSETPPDADHLEPADHDDLRKQEDVNTQANDLPAAVNTAMSRIKYGRGYEITPEEGEGGPTLEEYQQGTNRAFGDAVELNARNPGGPLPISEILPQIIDFDKRQIRYDPEEGRRRKLAIANAIIERLRVVADELAADEAADPEHKASVQADIIAAEDLREQLTQQSEEDQP